MSLSESQPRPPSASPWRVRRAALTPVASGQQFFISTVPAGFPSPAEDYEDVALDLNTHFIKHPAATFFVQARGESMIGAGIHDGDLLIVDRAVTPKSGMVIIATIDNEFTVKRFVQKGKNITLKAENPAYDDIVISSSSDFMVWGVVTQVIHNPNSPNFFG